MQQIIHLSERVKFNENSDRLVVNNLALYVSVPFLISERRKLPISVFLQDPESQIQDPLCVDVISYDASYQEFSSRQYDREIVLTHCGVVSGNPFGDLGHFYKAFFPMSQYPQGLYGVRIYGLSGIEDSYYSLTFEKDNDRSATKDMKALFSSDQFMVPSRYAAMTFKEVLSLAFKDVRGYVEAMRLFWFFEDIKCDLEDGQFLERSFLEEPLRSDLLSFLLFPARLVPFMGILHTEIVQRGSRVEVVLFAHQPGYEVSQQEVLRPYKHKIDFFYPHLISWSLKRRDGIKGLEARFSLDLSEYKRV